MSGVGRTFPGLGEGTVKIIDANLYISYAFLAPFVYANNVRLIFWSGAKIISAQIFSGGGGLPLEIDGSTPLIHSDSVEKVTILHA